ncbi:protein PHOTOPERIOD-INDEPENDENT EARLY FLOWERING 1 isoform X1 [Rhododendron vialii]|uniref:protein PHOTOPERIOD-INDEPENDENT EARLY FLOWERING 1 isoform X1 n=1 Tax=Rhododendron vialii TaxID=182163 RepID=UPI0026604E26|nr:protein PHOTOPERIOD-INDEPENDENT EARLY FLOWERING 1 isoform X1 [Rhododendron vialii]XP_058207570.1 protein PHOTOPERIOD-INDEPENDENT EARLY FLOWERING 1 isoform X1 [Rhododendron vialii]XP_058207571.1 protein PHOTOPERIOD-INDEPENDENT EARLY FLOWERING 1 isoform X1 [Rhododendron vialii]XP_058207573.1 protein PHOTOPERIOD-INDEPENDENT EARLY FLOWERING 1 isoform X1 [Rhododendron vialii]XP_058207574.1 protein PHOTOPERIOD-INDEPENDENT EARLY FLOWERING 1 isoform X1 [Rhododendron vialii]XP_058207575.1 protein PH
MASKGLRSKLDHETRARRQKVLEPPKEPRRPKTHWDHVLEEMVWLSKDFESERKWKLAQAKKVAIRASKGMLDPATRGEKRVKEEEQRLRKVALNISKDVKKFWLKIEKLVLYKHQLELDEKKKKSLDKQLEFLLGQTERYSTMLAENLVNSPITCKPINSCIAAQEQLGTQHEEGYENGTCSSVGLEVESQSDVAEVDEDFDVRSGDESEDDEHTLEEDEALITEEERKEELAALQNEVDLPLEELIKRYAVEKVSREGSPELNVLAAEQTHAWEDKRENKVDGSSSFPKNNRGHSLAVPGRRGGPSNGNISILENHIAEVKADEIGNLSERSGGSAKKHIPDDFLDEQEDGDFVLPAGEEKDDETTLSEEEELAKTESHEPVDEVALLQKESEIPLEELLARYKKVSDIDEDPEDDSQSGSASEDFLDSVEHLESAALEEVKSKQQHVPTKDDGEPSELQPVVGPINQEEVEPKIALEEGRESESRIADAAAAARSAQPTGNTFSTTKVRTKFPFLLKYPLREYQHIGLDWLVTMYEKRLNGILADEMGLGKTIMTIALLAHLACEKGIWGPHLIVVPTSVMLNWETEFLKWCPAFKILTYFGSAKERRIKRQGWMKPNYFHVCITTYRLVIQDSKIFKRKKWKYLILDEAHLIKNWKSQRWQTLLNFNSKRRILLTGTPLQNDLMELWSLMHFLMPHIFQSHQEFKDWFSNPISGMVEGQEKVNKEVVDRLHNVLRPFILRRLKRDVEKQLPMKHEHVLYCRLSRRQRNLYEDFIASSETQATLASSNFFGMISVIMQLRKVCNHPDLFEGRPIVSSFDMNGIEVQLSSSVCSMLTPDSLSTIDLSGLGLLFTHLDFSMNSWESEEVQAIATPSSLIKGRADLVNIDELEPGFKHWKKFHGTNIFEDIRKAILEERQRETKERTAAIAWWNSLRCRRKPVYSTTLQELVTVSNPVYDIKRQKGNPLNSSKLAEIVLSPVEHFQKMINQVESFMFAIPAARAPPPVCWCSKSKTSVFLLPTYKERCTEFLSPLLTPLRPAIVRRQLYFPDRRLIQFDCGKLQELSVLLRQLKSEGHRALIFTQMTKMLDILEAFINLYGYTYMRLDGSTQPEERQTLMQRFNTNPKYFLFILSTRSGGVGINLVGADTVIFYDSDWNPAMDQQAQDRCHRIGQTREVHIYRLISQSTIEENILKKAKQKRALDDLVIQSGGYNTDFFKKLDPVELFSGHQAITTRNMQREKNCTNGSEVSLSNADVEAALKHVEDEVDYMALKKVEEEEAVDNQEFNEEGIGRLEDDEFINEDDLKVDEAADPNGLISTSNKENGVIINGSDVNEETTLTLVAKEDDVDMLADVKQMAAAAAAAGQAMLSFESQLRPIDCYAIRYLELWDPIIDKTSKESEVRFEESEWELDRIEKLKEDMEAEIDDDEEPFVYERWDADFATEAYRQQVEALAQHQLMEDLAREAEEKEQADRENSDSIRNDVLAVSKPKSKKKPKKAKFKSLKKAALASESKAVKEDLPNEHMSIDDEATSYDTTSSEMVSRHLTVKKKRKEALDGDEENSSRKSKKVKKARPELCAVDLESDLPSEQLDEPKYSKLCGSVDLEQKPIGRSKMAGKVSITAMPVKRVLTIKPEKLKKKGNIWSRDCLPLPDFWMPEEDAMLCALVHEYGPHWSLVSETLYGMVAGGLYRGRYRHSVHCCERYRELIQRHVLSAADNPNNEKAGNTCSGKALLKVTEDNIRVLLDVATELPDNEPLLQKHFFAVLYSVWRMTSRFERRQSLSSSRNGFYYGGRHVTSIVSQIDLNSTRESSEPMRFTNLTQCSNLVAAALCDADSVRRDDGVSVLNQREEASGVVDRLEITLELQRERGDSVIPLPSVINLSIFAPDPPSPSASMSANANQHLRSVQSSAESHFRTASRDCTEGSLSWASAAFQVGGDVHYRTPSKSQALGKHKLSIFESVKTSKSKLRKTTSEYNDITRPPFADLVVRPTITFPADSSFDLTPPHFTDPRIDVFDSDIPFDMDRLSLESQDVIDLVSHDYLPGFISGLDDCSSLPELTDIG